MKSNEEINPHVRAAKEIVPLLIDNIKASESVFVITVAGESGSGKTETGSAIGQELRKHDIASVVLNQDNYFFLPPTQNDAKRKSDPAWLGPWKEVNLPLLGQNIRDAKNGSNSIEVPFIEYFSTEIETRLVDLKGLKVLIVEGTYVSLLRDADIRIFIAANYIDTLPYRKLRNRGNEVNDPFVENILATEHKIISGHRFLADFLIYKDYTVKSNL